MRLAWATDIHLNFLSPTGRAAFAASVRDTGADALLITGDIAEGHTVAPLLTEFQRAIERPIFFVLGNHDYYESSVARVRSDVRVLGGGLVWLHEASGLLLSDSALIGVDGWADGRYGDYARSGIELNDYSLIEDFRDRSKIGRLTVMQALADESARRLRMKLHDALMQDLDVIVATHVPPFAEACWHEGKISGPDWLPHFACKATGDVLLETAETWPDRQIEVYCGHTHSGGVAHPLENLTVFTGAAVYGAPVINCIIEVE